MCCRPARVQLLAEGSSRVAHLDGLLDPSLRTLALGHAEALRDHHHLEETVGTVALRTILGEAVSAAQGGGEAAGPPSWKTRAAPCPLRSWRP